MAQKGPLIAGSALTLQVLGDDLIQTGASFSTNIVNDDGEFNLGDVDLGGNPFLEIFADGYYFNEVTGEISDDRLALFTLADTSSSEININILSHLERPRTKYLFLNPEQITGLDSDGLSDSEIFQAAKSQAQAEVLQLFQVDAGSLDLDNSDSFNITGGETGDHVLTAVSVILQGYRSVGEMTELLAEISDDLEEDGDVDDQSILNDLYTAATYINPSAVTTNLVERFSGLDESTAGGWVPYFENFLQNSGGELEGGLFLPETQPVTYAIVNGEPSSADQPNLLSENVGCIGEGGRYGFAADVPSGFELEVKLTVTEGLVNWVNQIEGTGWYQVAESGNDAFEVLEADLGTVENVGRTETLATNLSSDSHESEIILSGHGVVQVDYYANGLEAPYLTKTITVFTCDSLVHVMPDDPDMPEYPLSICDVTASEFTCENPTVRADEPAVTDPNRP